MPLIFEMLIAVVLPGFHQGAGIRMLELMLGRIQNLSDSSSFTILV
jgi:hypothetical protein